MKDEKTKNLPVKKFRSGAITATIWQNTIKKDGQEIDILNITLEKSYKDGDAWKTTGSLNSYDLPKAILVMQKAYEYISLKHDEQ